MSKSKFTDKICGAGALLMVLLTLLYLCGGNLFVTAQAADAPYVKKLFSTDKVHTIDIVVQESEWEEMLENAREEEYISCNVVIDGESRKNVAIRPKGNSSLSTVASSDSDRYSFKIEFDHYDGNNTYYGLDKLCLNNVIQDNTYMKDFLCYRMMNFMGADSPLSSFVWITVNGKDWGLYVAAEGIEDAFAQRVYGANHGQIYKPDSMDLGGGGRGAEARNMDGMELPENFERPENAGNTEQPEAPDQSGNVVQPGDADSFGDPGQSGNMPRLGAGQGFQKSGGGPGSSSDVLLQYSDDDPASYPNIFDNNVFETVSEADQQRLIESLKKLNEGDVEHSLNVDEVLRYFAVHNFVLNGDSYTGSIVHNYYLYEKEGLLSMIAWDYNLAFGGMGAGGMEGSSATAAVNSPIDSPVSSGELSERPMVSWIFSQEEYTERYHQMLEELMEGFFESGAFTSLVEETAELISPYVQRDPTAFCTYEEFQKGVETLKEFCTLRAQSVRGQLEGEIPSTSEGQEADPSALIDASTISLSDMGSQGGEMSGGFTNDGMMPFGQPGSEPSETAGEDQTKSETPEEEAAPTEEDPTEDENGNERDRGFSPTGQMPGNPGQAWGAAPGEEMSGAASGGERWLWLGGSLLLLAAGLCFAKYYR